jgi:hypothetical protein
MFNQKRQAAAPRVHPNNQNGESRLKRRGHGDLNAALLQKMYFATSSKNALPDHTMNQTTLIASAQPSMKSLHVGPGYVKSEVPLPQRSQCTHAREYQVLPLDDAPVQREMRQLIASSSRKGQGQVVEGLRLSSETTTKAYYGSFGDKLVQSQPASFAKPDQNIRLDRDSKFMESKTCFQRAYQGYDEALQKQFRQPVTNGMGYVDSPIKRRGDFNDMTSYKREFGKEPIARYPGMPKSQSAADVLLGARARQAAAFSGRN